jgi:hypothetical protein
VHIRRIHCMLLGTMLMVSTGQVISCQSAESVLARLTSINPSARSNAFGQLVGRGGAEHFAVCSPSASAEISRSLITALENENVSIHTGQWDEDETEFYATLIGCVAALRNPRGAHALVGAIDTGWGALDAILDLSDAAVPEVAAVLKDSRSRSTARMFAASTLGMFVGQSLPLPVPGFNRPDPKPVSAASRAIIRESLLAALVDKNPMVGSAAVTSLGAFSGDDISRAIVAAATLDSGIQFGSGARKFPVKEAARTWLRQDSLKIKK